MGGWMALASVLSFVAIAIERFIVIWQPFWKCRFTMGKKLVGIICVWIWSFSLAFPPIIGWGKYVLEANGIFVCFDHVSQTYNNSTYILFLFIGGYGVPLLVIAVCYVKIILVVRQKSTGHQRLSVRHKIVVKEEFVCLNHLYALPTEARLFYTQMPNSRMPRRSSTYPPTVQRSPSSLPTMPLNPIIWARRRTDLKLAKSALALLVVFIVCWTPYAIIALLSQFCPQANVPPATAIACVILAKTSVLLHPICYKVTSINSIKRGRTPFTPLRKFNFPLNRSDIPVVSYFGQNRCSSPCLDRIAITSMGSPQI